MNHLLCAVTCFAALVFGPVASAQQNALTVLAAAPKEDRVVGQETGIVSLTFDDTLKTQHDIGFTIMKEHGLVGTLYLTTQTIDEPAKNKLWQGMSWGDIKEFKDAGWEMGAHTISHRNLTTLDDEELKEELTYPPEIIFRRLGVRPTSFASPFGAVNDHVMAMVKKTPYANHVLAWGGIPEVGDGFNKLHGTDPYAIARVTVKRDMLPEQVCSWVNKAAEKKEWLVLMFHGFADSMQDTPDYEYVVMTGDLDKIAKCVADAKAKGQIRVMTVSDAAAITASPKRTAAN